MASKTKQEAQQPLILRAHRLMEAFAKSDDERDFYLDRLEGFIVYVDLDHPENELDNLETELLKEPDRYCSIPKLTFYETKKIMEGFVNEKVYDIDTKEKLLDIIQSKEARANFLEFIYDHHTEFEKWQQYYQERSRIRIIEWLRQNHFHFVFEEDLELARNVLEKLKQSLFDVKVNKEVVNFRKLLVMKAKTYYSNEALNPRPKRGRPPKQAIKQEIEPQVTSDIYLTVPDTIRPFLFIPEISGASGITFSADFGDRDGLAAKRNQGNEPYTGFDNLQQKLASLRSLSNKWVKPDEPAPFPVKASFTVDDEEDEDDEDDEDDFDDDDDEDDNISKKAKSTTKAKAKKTLVSKAKQAPLNGVKAKAKAKPKPKAKAKPAPTKPRRIIPAKAALDSEKTKKSQKPKRIIPIAVKAKPLKRVLGTQAKPKAEIKSHTLPKKK